MEVPETSRLIDDWRYDKILNSEYYDILRSEAEKSGDVFSIPKMIGLTDYGMQLREICLE